MVAVVVSEAVVAAPAVLFAGIDAWQVHVAVVLRQLVFLAQQQLTVYVHIRPHLMHVLHSAAIAALTGHTTTTTTVTTTATLSRSVPQEAELLRHLLAAVVRVVVVEPIIVLVLRGGIDEAQAVGGVPCDDIHLIEGTTGVANAAVGEGVVQALGI